MRKSQLPSKEIAGNTEKYQSYREAWSRIKLAQENDFFLEAITIEESIISDRLISCLSSTKSYQDATSKKSDGSFLSFGKLIRCWRSEISEPLQSGSYPNLIEAVDQWRRMRNNAIHAIVKAEAGELTLSIDEFLQKAKNTAKEGEKLTREVCNWSKKEAKKASFTTTLI